ncbi:hypothetical protein Tco_1139084, partial [Tanacetum coccineum]
MIDQGVTAALATRDANRSTNGEDNHNSGMCVRRNERADSECTYSDFMKCQPLNFKGTKGVIELTQWTIGNDVANAITWTKLKKKMTDKSPTNANTANNQKGNGTGQKPICYECGAPRTFQEGVSKTEEQQQPRQPKKIVRIPWGNETLIVHGDGSNRGNETRLNIISCTKTQKYMLKGCQVFLAHVTTKETEDKSENKRVEDVPIIQD